MKNLQTICSIFVLVALNSLIAPKALSQTEISDFSSIVENPVEGQKVTVKGKIIEQIEGTSDYVLSDGTNKIIIHLEDNDVTYTPDTIVEVSGTIGLEPHHLHEGDHDYTETEMEIVVEQIQVITANE
ncbi:MAG: hypothetical protein AB4368_13115 [Xenococcaceae cyanobacterium]